MTPKPPNAPKPPRAQLAVTNLSLKNLSEEYRLQNAK